jgi:hypothetical protein
MAVGIGHADHVAPLPQKLALISPTSGGSSVCIVHLQTQATEFVCFLYYAFNIDSNFKAPVSTCMSGHSGDVRVSGVIPASMDRVSLSVAGYNSRCEGAVYPSGSSQ